MIRQEWEAAYASLCREIIVHKTRLAELEETITELVIKGWEDDSTKAKGPKS